MLLEQIGKKQLSTGKFFFFFQLQGSTMSFLKGHRGPQKKIISRATIQWKATFRTEPRSHINLQDPTSLSTYQWHQCMLKSTNVESGNRLVTTSNLQYGNGIDNILSNHSILQYIFWEFYVILSHNVDNLLMLDRNYFFSEQIKVNDVHFWLFNLKILIIAVNSQVFTCSCFIKEWKYTKPRRSCSSRRYFIFYYFLNLSEIKDCEKWTDCISALGA